MAARLHVTASVMTRSLGRIIHTTGDQAPSRELDPATLERTFTLRRHDSLVALSGPALLAAVRGQAPGVRLRFVAESSLDTPELRRGEADLEANANRSSAPYIRTENVGETRLVIVVRQGHPLPRINTVTAEQSAISLTRSTPGR